MISLPARVSLLGCARIVVGSSGEPRRAAPADQPEHDRLRPAAGVRRAAGALPDAARSGPRRALRRRQGALPPLRADLAHVRRRASGRLSPQPTEGLVGAVLAA